MSLDGHGRADSVSTPTTRLDQRKRADRHGVRGGVEGISRRLIGAGPWRGRARDSHSPFNLMFVHVWGKEDASLARLLVYTTIERSKGSLHRTNPPVAYILIWMSVAMCWNESQSLLGRCLGGAVVCEMCASRKAVITL